MKISGSLARMSRAMAWIALASAVLYPTITVLCFILPDQTHIFGMSMDHVGAPVTSAVPLEDRSLALLVALVPTAFGCWSLFALSRAFTWFYEGEVFALVTLKALRQVATALFLNVVAAFLAEGPISYFLTRSSHGIISLSFGSPDIEMLFLAGSTVVVAHVLAEARRIAIENESFV